MCGYRCVCEYNVNLRCQECVGFGSKKCSEAGITQGRIFPVFIYSLGAWRGCQRQRPAGQFPPKRIVQERKPELSRVTLVLTPSRTPTKTRNTKRKSQI